MRVLICGGRHFGIVPRNVTRFTPAWYAAQKRADEERDLLALALTVYRARGMSVVIHGAAKGADDWASCWAASAGVPEEPYPAAWKDIDHPDAVVRTLPGGRRYDANAGPRRNARMLAEGKPDLVLAFAGGKGTRNMIEQAETAGVPVVRVTSTSALPTPHRSEGA